jgi:hypothetical protein
MMMMMMMMMMMLFAHLRQINIVNNVQGITWGGA